MQFNHKTDVNIIRLCEDIINNLNKMNKNKVYDLRITDKAGKADYRPNEKKGKEHKPGKTILFTLSEIDTKERTTLYSATYTFNDAKDQLKGTYKRKLHEYFLYGCITGYALQAEQIIKRQNIHRGMAMQEKMAAMTEHPVTPDEAIKPEDYIKTE